MSHTGQAALRHHLPDLAENARTMTGAQLARHYGIGHQAISRHLKRAGLTAQKHAPGCQSVTDDQLRELAKTMSGRAIADHTGAHRTAINRRLKALGITAAAPKPVSKYADIAEHAATMHVQQLAEHYGTSLGAIYNALSERGLSAAPKPVSRTVPGTKRAAPYKLVPHATPFTDRRVKSSADLAAEWLQKECAVYHCDDAGRPDPKGRFYRRGRAVLTPDEVIARAVAKGWRANAWMECAA